MWGSAVGITNASRPSATSCARKEARRASAAAVSTGGSVGAGGTGGIVRGWRKERAALHLEEGAQARESGGRQGKSRETKASARSAGNTAFSDPEREGRGAAMMCRVSALVFPGGGVPWSLEEERAKYSSKIGM